MNETGQIGRNESRRTLIASPIARRRSVILAALFLASVLAIAFSPALFGGRTLLLASWDAPSVTTSGAYDETHRPLRLQRTADPGASAWQSEAWYKLLSDEFWGESSIPLWNPYNGYGTPLLANAISQPFFPLTTLLSLYVTPWTYNLFILSRLFVGGMLMFFFARQFLTALPSLFSAVTFMLSGYFIIYLNIAHLSVEVLTPGVFLAFELLLRKNSWTAVGGIAAMILLGMAGGMPESLFLILAFGSLYFVCRLVFAPDFRVQASALLLKFTLSVILGFGLSAFLLLPFLEFLGVAHDVHQTANVGDLRGGLSADANYRSTIQYLLPLIFGPILNSIFANFIGWSGLRGYWGIIPVFFAALALLTVFRRGVSTTSSTERFLTAFFAITLVLMILKRFGNVVINWIGYLPLSEMVLYTKYLEPLMALCIAMLGGLGFQALVQRRAAARQLLAAASTTLGLMLFLAASYVPAVWSTAMKTTMFYSFPIRTSLFFYVSIACGIAVLLVAAAMARSASRASDTIRPRVLRGIVVLLSLELTFNYIVPSFYLLSSLPPQRANPYKGAPYIDVIRARNTDHFRVFGRENILYPNWSSVFGLADVRNLDAMHFKRYRTFIRSFLLPAEAEGRLNGDLADRFSGGEFPYEFDTEVEKRYLALSSIKYLISDSEYGWDSKLVNGIVDQHRGENIWGFAADTFRIGETRLRTMRGLFQHPPSSRIGYRTVIGPGESVLEGIAAIKAEAVAMSDGAGFRLEIRDGGRIETLFETLVDPQNIPADRAGHPFRLDLSRYAGREVELLFSTDPGPKGIATADWAVWAGLRFVPKDAAPPSSAFTKVYDGEVSVYEVPSVLPRASLAKAIEIVPDGEVLRRLKDPEFDPTRKIIVSRESIPAEDAGLFQSLAAPETGVPIKAAIITHYQARRVRIETESEAPAFLMLNDTNFPGWRVDVNGKSASIVMANFLFRGVFIPAGKNVVEFNYEPRSFQVGVGLSLAAFAALLGLMYRERRRLTIAESGWPKHAQQTAA